MLLARPLSLSLVELTGVLGELRALWGRDGGKENSQQCGMHVLRKPPAFGLTRTHVFVPSTPSYLRILGPTECQEEPTGSTRQTTSTGARTEPRNALSEAISAC